jgi:hypothetical protein
MRRVSAVGDWVGEPTATWSRRLAKVRFSLTPRFSGVAPVQLGDRNRFSGFYAAALGMRCWKPLKRLGTYCGAQSPR